MRKRIPVLAPDSHGDRSVMTAGVAGWPFENQAACNAPAAVRPADLERRTTLGRAARDTIAARIRPTRKVRRRLALCRTRPGGGEVEGRGP